MEAIKLIKSVATVPIIFNGDVFTMQDVDRFVKETGVDGTPILYLRIIPKLR